MKHAIFLLLPATALFYYEFYLEQFETGKAFALITFACFAIFQINWREAIKDKITQALLWFIVSAGVSTFLSIDRHMSFFGNYKANAGFLVIASYAVLYAAIKQSIRSSVDAKRIIDITLSCSVIVSIYALAQALGFDFKKWNGMLTTDGYTRPMSTLGHPNFLANYLGMILPFALWRMDEASKKIEKYAFGSLVVIFLAVILLCLSRGMLIASIAGAVCYFLITKTYRKKALNFFFTISVLFILIFSFLPSFRHTSTGRLINLFTPGPARIEYPKAAFRIWKKYPWFGVGTNAFEIGFQHQRTAWYWQIERNGSPHFAHNDFLTILANQGIFGAITSILLSLTIAFYAFKSRSSFAASAIGSIVVFYIAGLTSSFVVATGVLLMFHVALLRIKHD